jgi:uncharacterized protein YbbC (DUF1343 family)
MPAGCPACTSARLYYQPYYAVPYAKARPCGGVQLLHITDPRDRVALTPLQFHIMDAVHEAQPRDRSSSADERDNMFDKVTGTNQIREMMSAGKSLEQVLSVWGAGVDQFREQRRAYLLYR